MRSDPKNFWEVVEDARKGAEGWQAVDLIDTVEPIRCLARLATIIEFIPEPPMGIEIHIAPGLAARLPILGEWSPDFPHRITIVPDPETPEKFAEVRFFKVG